MFKNKHIIITGGSSGIGKAIAKLLATYGTNISIISRNPTKLKKAQQEIDSVKINPQQQILTFIADVSQQIEITNAIERSIAILGTPDILITSAGIAIPGYFSQLDLEVHQKSLEVNYFGSLYAIKAVIKPMSEVGKGNIILISSAAGLIGLYGYSAYCPSKFAVRGLGESLRGELKPLGIKVSVVYPPDTDTPQLKEENKTKPKATKKITGSTKIWTPEEVAKEIIRGIKRKQFAIAPGLEIKLLNRWNSVLFDLLNIYFDRIIKKFPPNK